jgi:Helix-turn-helix of DDE superfamily endonuclease
MTILKTRSAYDRLSHLSDEQFRRLTGVKRPTFTVMVEILTSSDQSRKSRGGRESKLVVEDRLLMALEYLREYRTYFHISQSYGVSESNAYKICRWVEDTLIKDKRFALPGRKALLKSDVEFKIVLVDASESPIQRPKKDKSSTTQAKRSATPSRVRS